MRQVFLEKGLIKVKEVAQPLLSDSTVLVHVHYSCISPGTEGSHVQESQKHLFSNIAGKAHKVMHSLISEGIHGTRLRIQEKLAGTVHQLGYSCSGQVVAVGKNVQRFRPGDYVACAGAGLANHAEFIVTPENLMVHVSDKRFLPFASMTTLGAIALQGVRRAQLQLGEVVCVIGLGLLGQLTVQLAKRSGCKVIGIDLVQNRLEQAHQHGADYVLDAESEDVVNTIAYATQHHGVDATIITAASQSHAILQQAMQITRKKGRVVIVGDVGLYAERTPFYQKEIDLLMSCSYGPGRYDKGYEEKGVDYPYSYVRWTENRNMQAVVELLSSGQLNVFSFVETMPLDEVEQAYEKLNARSSLAVILSYQSAELVEHQSDSTKKEQQQSLSFSPARKDVMRLGVIGVGGFAKAKLLPLVSRIQGVTIQAIVDAQNAQSLTVSKIYGAACTLTDAQDLFSQDLVDVVVIASPHTYHFQQAYDALYHGKAVFLEKPMVTDVDQLRKLTSYLQEHPTVPFCVDYNRSFAPFMQKIKEQVINRSSPLIAHYRMNAGFIPKDHWTQTEIGAGRIIGEACHIIDLFHYLTDANVMSISVESLHSASDDLLSTDNMLASMTFTDGSVCSLLYTALGNNQLGKERMEVFFDGKSIVMDDFKVLTGYGFPKSFNETSLVQDKGHERLLNAFFSSLLRYESSYKPLIPYKRLHDVAHITLLIDELARHGGGQKVVS